MIAAIVLAAGTSSRFGTNKLLLPFGGRTVVAATASAVVRAGERPIVVVTGHQRAEVEAALAGLPVTFVHNSDFLAGEMLSSIKAGLRHVEQHFPASAEGDAARDAAMIVLGDLPLIDPALVQRLVVAFEQGCGELLAPRHGLSGRRGHPVLIARKWWPAVHALPPGANVRDLLQAAAQAHPAALAHLVVTDDSILLDVDTPAAYQSALLKSTEYRAQNTDRASTTPISDL
jgi:molybdenum cofactor cytidylyltransferase